MRKKMAEMRQQVWRGLREAPSRAQAAMVERRALVPPDFLGEGFGHTHWYSEARGLRVF